MCKQTSLKNRKPQRDVLMSLLCVLKRDKNNKPSVLIVPGSNGTQYRVILRRNGRSISAECAKELGDIGHKDCKGNKCAKTLCKHSMAAIEYTIREAGFLGHWCEVQKDAQKLHNMLGGSIFEAHSWNGKGTASILVTKNSYQ